MTNCSTLIARRGNKLWTCINLLLAWEIYAQSFWHDCRLLVLVFQKPASMWFTLRTIWQQRQCTQWEMKSSHLCLRVVGTKWCVLCELCVSLCAGTHTVRAYHPAFLAFFFLFILLYSYIHILSDWANCSCSCILCRFNYTPLWASWKKMRVGKEGCEREKVWESKKKNGKAKRGLRRSLIRDGKVERDGEKREDRSWEAEVGGMKLERGVRAVPWVIYICKGKISSLECTL